MSQPSEELERHEAAARRLMAKHAAIKPRGWQTIRDREAIHREIDIHLDRYNILRELELGWSIASRHIKTPRQA